MMHGSTNIKFKNYVFNIGVQLLKNIDRFTDCLRIITCLHQSEGKLL